MIKILSDFPGSVLAFSCEGRVTKADYETVLIPAVERALKAHRKVRLYYQVGPGLDGFDTGAMWDDFKVGMEHLTRWERTAVVTDVDWVRIACRAFSFMMPGAVRVFSLNQAEDARKWIVDIEASK